MRFSSGFRRPPFFPHGFYRPRFFRARLGWYYGYSGVYYGNPGYYTDYGYPLMSFDASPSYASAAAYFEPSSPIQEEIDRLENEVERLREERETPETVGSKLARSDLPATFRSDPPSGPHSNPPPNDEPQSTTVLVFRDKHTQEVHNYAVVGQTLWIFTERRAMKLPLTSLDIPATTEANQDRGVDFRLPN
jgi:hypothetical protein